MQSYPTTHRPKFDKKYKTIIEIKNPDNYLEMINWVNTFSKDSVDVEVEGNGFNVCVYFAFESEDDALVFKIKYSK